MDFSNYSPWSLFRTLSTFPPEVIKDIESMPELEQIPFSPVIKSPAFWKDMYVHTFSPSYLSLDTAQQTDVNWHDRFAGRYDISRILESKKPICSHWESNEGSVQKVRTCGNSFAFNSPSMIRVVIYDYLDTECKYEKAQSHTVQSSDFIYLDPTSILGVSDDTVTLVDLVTNKQTVSPLRLGKQPVLEGLNHNLFAVVSSQGGKVFDVRDNYDQKCSFTNYSSVLALSHENNTLYIATERDITAHDIRNPKGPILWNYANIQGSKFASFNLKARVGMIGTSFVNLLNGQQISKADVEEETCGSVLNDNIAVIGCSRRSVLFHDFRRKKTIYTLQFSEDESIRSIHCSNLINGTVAIAGDYCIKIVQPSIVDGAFEAKIVRSVLTGSIGARKRNELKPIREVIFDGERIITNMDTFVRWYDFYTTFQNKQSHTAKAATKPGPQDNN